MLQCELKVYSQGNNEMNIYIYIYFLNNDFVYIFLIMIGNNTSRVVHVMIAFNKVYYNCCWILFKFLLMDVDILILLPIIFNGGYYNHLWQITWLFICDNSTWLTEHRRRPNLPDTAFTDSIGPVIVNLTGCVPISINWHPPEKAVWWNLLSNGRGHGGISFSV